MCYRVFKDILCFSLSKLYQQTPWVQGVQSFEILPKKTAIYVMVKINSLVPKYNNIKYVFYALYFQEYEIQGMMPWENIKLWKVK